MSLEVFGNKAKWLKKLKDNGFRVLPSLSIQADEDLIKNGVSLAKFDSLISSSNRETLYAVRSSSVHEDTEKSSAAGKFKTMLGVPKEKLPDACIQVAQSMLSQGTEDSLNGIVIQPFLYSENAISGVMFTHPERWMVNYAPGLCNHVVQGLPSEQKGFHPSGKEWMSESIKQIVGQVFNKKSKKIIEKTYPKSPWSSKIKKELSKLYHRVQTAFQNQSMDVEWTIVDNKLYVLQIRPVTVDWLANIWLFDNSNLAESYTGTVSPMTVSVASRLYKYVYRDLLRKSGVSETKINKHSKIFDHLVKGFHGRLYYVMNHWYAMMSFLPGYQRNKVNLEQMITSEIRQDIFLPESIKPNLGLRFLYYPLILWKTIFFPFTTRKFHRNVLKDFKELKELDLSRFKNHELQELWNSLEKKWLRNWYITVENDTVLMTFLGWAEKKYSSSELQSFISIETPSVNQLKDFKKLSNSIFQEPELCKVLNDNEEALFSSNLKRYPVLYKNWNTYFSIYGGRFPNELKLESPSPMDDFSALTNSMREIISSPLKSKISEVKQKSPWGIRQLQHYIRQRESFRLLRSTAFGWLRKILLNAGNLALKSNHLNQRDDIFYLTIQEWFQGNEENWKDIVSSRKHEYDKHSQDRYPRSFASTPSAEPPEYKANPLSEGYGKGQIVFPGFIEGKILVMKEYQPGPWPDFDILIAKHTDPGWSLLISKSKGLVVEQGGLLSHASIVTRELGIPCVIGVKEATDRFKNESNAVLDASNGTIEIKNQK